MSCDRWSCATGDPCLSHSPLKPSLASSANQILKPDKWRSTFGSHGKVFCFDKVLKRIVLGGVDPTIRPQVWEFLLGCYALGSTAEYRRRLRTARRERYEHLVKQCRTMHSSIGTGSLAYAVGSKVMDARATSSDNGRRESDIASRQASVDNNASIVECNYYRSNGTDASSPGCHSESFPDYGDLVCARRSEESAAYESSFLAPSSSSKNYDALNGEREVDDGSQCVNGSYFDFPLPVTNLFRTSEEDKNEGGIQNGKLSRRKLRFDIEKMHNFQINNNEELIIESTISSAINVSNSEIEMECDDTHNTIYLSNNVEKKKQIVNRMRISDVPEMEFIDGTLPGVEPVSKDKVSEWLWTLHRIVVDVVRTDSHLEFYEDTKNLARMSDILAVYAWVDPQTGYCQGMSDLLSPFVVLYEDDADAFWCFEMLLRRMRENFQMEGPTGVMKQLQQLSNIMEVTDREMFSHLLHIGAETLHFAFRMLLVLFRRELPFDEALSMWEMMWAADFDESMANNLVENCLEALNVQIEMDSEETEVRDETVESCGNAKKNSLQSSNDKNGNCSVPNEIEMKSATRNFCGLTRNFWSRNDTMEIRTSVSSTKKGDDGLPVFCVAAILIINRQKIIRDTHSIDDMIKIFNDKILRIDAKRCVRTAIKLRKKYFYKISRKISTPSNDD